MVNQLHLLGRRINLHALDLELVVRQVDREVLVADLLRLSRFLFADAAEHRVDARDDLLRLKGLDHVVVRAELEPEHLVEHLALCGEHDDGALRFLADLAANLPAVELGQHDVEQNEVGVHRVKHLHGGLAVICDGGFEAFLFDIEPQKLADISVVVYNENFSGCHMLSLLSLIFKFFVCGRADCLLFCRRFPSKAYKTGVCTYCSFLLRRKQEQKVNIL